jgi:hypothetical protein
MRAAIFVLLISSSASASTLLMTIDGNLYTPADREYSSLVGRITGHSFEWLGFDTVALDGSSYGTITLEPETTFRYVNHFLTDPDETDPSRVDVFGPNLSFQIPGVPGSARLRHSELLADGTYSDMSGGGGPRSSLVVESRIPRGSPNFLTGTDFHLTHIDFRVTNFEATVVQLPLHIGLTYYHDVSFLVELYGEPGEVPEPPALLLALAASVCWPRRKYS